MDMGRMTGRESADVDSGDIISIIVSNLVLVDVVVKHSAGGVPFTGSGHNER